MELKRLIKDWAPIRFISWLRRCYREEMRRTYIPEQFREYGKDVCIGRSVSINMPQRVILKDRVLIHDGTMINSSGGLYVGENTGIGYNCTIFTVQHHYRNAKAIPFDEIIELKPVIIREFVWIGAGVMIMPGVEIGEGAIIGMGSVVTKNIPPLAIILGNPAEIIGYRSKEHYYECKKEGKFQHTSVGKYTETIPYMVRVRYEKELRELGLIE